MTRPRLRLLPDLSPAEWTVLAALMLAAAVVAALVVTATMPQGRAWRTDASDATAPNWLTTDTLRVVANGQAIRARLSLDAPDAATRAWLNSDRQVLNQLLQATVSESDLEGTAGSERMKRLASEVTTRLNDTLEASNVPPVREVVIQDLVFNKT